MQKGQNVRRRRRRLNARGVAAIVILLLLVALGLALVLWPREDSGTNATLRPLEFSANEEHYFTGDGFFVVRGNTLNYMGLSSDKNNWSLQLTGTGYRIAASTDIIVVYGDNVLQAADYSGNSLFPSLEFSGTIEDARCGKNYIAALKKDPSGVYMIYLFNKKGDRLDILEFKDSYPLDFGFYQAKDSLWTLSLNSSGLSPVCTITTYDTGQAIIGRIPVEGQLVSGVYYDGNSIYAAGTDYLYAFDSAGKQTYSKLVYGWQTLDFAVAGNKPMFLTVKRDDFPSTGGAVAARLCTATEGAADVNFRLPPGAIAAYILGDTVAVVTVDTLYRFEASTGSLKTQVPLGVIVDDVEKLDSSRLLLHCGGALYLYKS